MRLANLMRGEAIEPGGSDAVKADESHVMEGGHCRYCGCAPSWPKAKRPCFARRAKERQRARDQARTAAKKAARRGM